MSDHVSVLPDGTKIGWDMCGGCSRYVTICTCTAGPTPPRYVVAMLAREQAAAGIPKPAATTPVLTQNPPSGSSSKSGVASCRGCGSAVTNDTADRNDDGTWTCHTCQRAASADG